MQSVDKISVVHSPCDNDNDREPFGAGHAGDSEGSSLGEKPVIVDRYELLDASGRSVNRRGTPRSLKPRAPISVAILATCCLVYLIFNIMLAGQPHLLVYLVFSPGNGLVFPGLISHMFAHANLGHLLGNMLVLYFLGTMVEQRYGSLRYGVLYFSAGMIAAFSQAAVSPDGLLLGASGALAGVMAAFVRHFPHMRLYIWALIPMPAWLFILLWLAYNLFGVHAGGGMGVAFTAHLAGFISGLVISLILMPPRRRK